jgi:hypothetical protein
VLASVLVSASLESQTVLERAKQRARERVERQTDAAIEKTLDAAGYDRTAASRVLILCLHLFPSVRRDDGRRG